MRDTSRRVPADSRHTPRPQIFGTPDCPAHQQQALFRPKRIHGHEWTLIVLQLRTWGHCHGEDTVWCFGGREKWGSSFIAEGVLHISELQVLQDVPLFLVSESNL